MRKSIVCLLVVFISTLSACSFSKADVDNARVQGFDSGYSQGYKEGYEEGYGEGRDDGYKDGYSALKPVSMPASGTILSGKEYNASEITVTADSSSSYVVSLKTSNGTERVSFFIRSGDSVTIGVPSEYLYVYFASGTTWYGYGKDLMFGEDTVYTKDDEMLDFVQYNWEYTLYPVYDGNFSETPSNEYEFFK